MRGCFDKKNIRIFKRSGYREEYVTPMLPQTVVQPMPSVVSEIFDIFSEKKDNSIMGCVKSLE